MIMAEFNPSSPIFGGVDLSSAIDVTAWAKVQRQEDQGWITNWRFWIPEETAQAAERRDNVPYLRWAADGIVELTPGSRINHETIKQAVIADCMTHDISRIGFDPFNTEWLQSQIEQEGIHAHPVPQTMIGLSEASKHFEASVASGTFRHGKNPTARWMAENVEASYDAAGNIRPVKPKHGSTKRIDGIVAAIMAIAVALVAPDDYLTSYDDPGT